MQFDETCVTGVYGCNPYPIKYFDVHAGAANWLFLDGHVEFINRTRPWQAGNAIRRHGFVVRLVGRAMNWKDHVQNFGMKARTWPSPHGSHGCCCCRSS